MKIQLDKWQKEVLQTKGHICLRSGRQVGKSTVISIKAGEYAIKHPKKTILVIAAVERQAYLIFEKILAYVYDNYKKEIKRGKDRPTKTKLKLKNGSIIHCLPVGLTGYGIRGYTIDLLIADEAAFIPDAVWTAVTPMLSVTKGDIILLSTPFGKGGYFYERFDDPTFTSFHVSSEECDRITDEFLAQERKTMTKLQYAQEYLGEFIDELRQFFSTKLINQTMTLGEEAEGFKIGEFYLGVDVARLGGDENSFVIVKKKSNESFELIRVETTEMKRTTDTMGKIIKLNKDYHFKQIYIDDAGVGGGVFDYLLEHIETKRKVVSINNARKPIEKDKKRRKKILKEDLYDNLLKLMESKQIRFIKSPELLRSLSSIQYEYTSEGNLKIFGKYSHIAEGAIRAAWCSKDKSLNIWIC